ncbi:MAG: hypothetical protein IJ055_01410 [Oscillospiraceae bacterium]|nr:hypothetical protein [Oscillospiraceae bacterium]
MSNRAKLLLSFLFIAAIILCVGLTRFYFDVTKNTGAGSGEDAAASITAAYGDMRIFQSVNGYYGLLDAEGTVVIAPEWMEILDVTDRLVIVSKRMGDEVLIGGVDYEENVVLPFAFSAMTEVADRYHIGTVADDGTRLVLDTDYQPIFRRSYESVSYESGILLLTTQGCTFRYDLSKEPPALQRAQMQCMMDTVRLDWNVGNQVYLAVFSEEDLLRINRCVSAYMDMLLQSDFTDLPEISGSDYIGGLTKPGTFTDLTVDGVSNFSFAQKEREDGTKEDGVYSFRYTLSCHPENGDSQTVIIGLSFVRNADNNMILSGANLDFQSAELSAPEETQAPEE